MGFYQESYYSPLVRSYRFVHPLKIKNFHSSSSFTGQKPSRRSLVLYFAQLEAYLLVHCTCLFRVLVQKFLLREKISVGDPLEEIFQLGSHCDYCVRRVIWAVHCAA